MDIIKESKIEKFTNELITRSLNLELDEKYRIVVKYFIGFSDYKNIKDIRKAEFDEYPLDFTLEFVVKENEEFIKLSSAILKSEKIIGSLSREGIIFDLKELKIANKTLKRYILKEINKRIDF